MPSCVRAFLESPPLVGISGWGPVLVFLFPRRLWHRLLLDQLQPPPVNLRVYSYRGYGQTAFGTTGILSAPGLTWLPKCKEKKHTLLPWWYKARITWELRTDLWQIIHSASEVARAMADDAPLFLCHRRLVKGPQKVSNLNDAILKQTRMSACPPIQKTRTFLLIQLSIFAKNISAICLESNSLFKCHKK